MKGFPIAETILCLGVLLSLLVPLSRTANVLSSGQASEEDPLLSPEGLLEGWLEVRFSHPPLSASLSQGEQVLWQGGSVSRADEDVNFDPALQNITMNVEWPDGVTTPYMGWRLETVEHGVFQEGSWGRPGQNRFSWHVNWKAQP